MQTLFRHRFGAMTTRCELQFYGADQDLGRLVADRIVARVAQLVQRYNFHAPGSWLNRAVNHRRGHTVALDDECADILHTVRLHAERLNGVFDITVGTYAHALRKAQSVAEADAVRRRLQPHTGLAAWQLSGRHLRFDSPVTRFDLGGVIKEYAVDEAVRIARQAGIRSGLVNFGGDLATFGRKPDGQRFVAAVPNPADPANLLFGLDLEDQALTTSAHYARRRRLRGGTLSHVVNADPERAAWLSASVVSRTALVSGIYSTALLIDPALVLPADTYAVAVDRANRLCRLPLLAA